MKHPIAGMHMHRRKVICTGYAAVASSKDCAGIASALDEMPRMMKHARSETLGRYRPSAMSEIGVRWRTSMWSAPSA